MLFGLLLFKGHVTPSNCEMIHPSVPSQRTIGGSQISVKIKGEKKKNLNFFFHQIKF